MQTGLAHELAHAYKIMQGKLAPYARDEINMANEGYAAIIENIIRRCCSHLCFRDCHHGEPIPSAYLRNKLQCP